jgi:hypothetical protein
MVEYPFYYSDPVHSLGYLFNMCYPLERIGVIPALDTAANISLFFTTVLHVNNLNSTDMGFGIESGSKTLPLSSVCSIAHTFWNHCNSVTEAGFVSGSLKSNSCILGVIIIAASVWRGFSAMTAFFHLSG